MTEISTAPHISVVTPSFNQGAFLAATIESVLAQAGAFTIDYTVVDGGSTDDSVAIIERYVAEIRDGRRPIACRGIAFRWSSERDRGQTDALAKGFRAARGSILCWLNSDDLYLPGTLQRVAEAFRDAPETGLVYGDAHYCDETGAIIGRYRTEAFDYRRLASFNYICQPAAFFRRSAFDAVGGLDETLQFAMDYDLWVRIGSRFACRHLPEFLAVYRLHPSSKTVRDDTLYRNAEEALRLAVKYFGWAPFTRVYNACSIACRSRLPAFLARRKSVLVPAAVVCSVLRSLCMNRGVDRRDLASLSGENFKKLFKSRIEIMTGKTGNTGN